MAVIYSRLWKSALLATQSTYFPPMVRAAAAFHDKVYTAEMLLAVAATPVIVDALALNEGESIDVPILRLMSASTTSANAVDRTISDAVLAYTPPPGPV